MNLPAWRPQLCHAERDCGCCGARSALICLEGSEHDGIHAFHCRNCGRSRDC